MVVEHGSQITRVPLDEREFTLGRNADNDIVIPDSFVSRRNAVLSWQGGSPKLVDLGSTNGMLVDGRLAKEIVLDPTTVVEIWDPARTKVVRIRYAPAGRPEAGVDYSPINPLIGPPTSTLSLGSAAWTMAIGRVEGNDLVLPHPQVSRHHATVEFRATGALLRDHSTNGTYINGQRVTGPRSVGPGDHIRIASFEFVFDGERLLQFDQTQRARVDAVNLSRVVGNGATILNNVSMSVLPREMIAIVGASGAGKSTLLDALNGFRPATSGAVYVNGRNYYDEYASMRLMVGYDPQSNVVHRDLPAGRALGYAASLRLPPDTTKSERDARVDEVLEEVGFVDRKDVLVGQLSGGQVKRVSIGVELLTRPSLFFLDEPTSGLDPGYEKRVMEILRASADGGRTVLLVTHATQSIELCDHIAVMASGGHLAFFGPPRGALSFFDTSDYPGLYRRLEEARSGAELEERFRQHASYAEFVQARAPMADSLPALDSKQGPATASLEAPPHPPTNRLRQTGILIQRYAEMLGRDRRNLALLLLQAPIIAALAAVIAKRHGLTALPDMAQARDLMVIMSCSMIWLGAMNASREIVKELPVYRRERMVGLGLLPYLTSKYVVLGTFCLFQAFILLVGLGLRTDYPAHGLLLPGGLELFITLGLTATAGLAMGLMISTLFQNADRASALVPYLLIPQIIFVVSELTGVANLIVSLTISHWSFEALGSTLNIAQSPEVLFGLSPDAFVYSVPFLVGRWVIILLIATIFALASALFLKRHDGKLM